MQSYNTDFVYRFCLNVLPAGKQCLGAEHNFTQTGILKTMNDQNSLIEAIRNDMDLKNILTSDIRHTDQIFYLYSIWPSKRKELLQILCEPDFIDIVDEKKYQAISDSALNLMKENNEDPGIVELLELIRFIYTKSEEYAITSRVKQSVYVIDYFDNLRPSDAYSFFDYLIKNRKLLRTEVAFNFEVDVGLSSTKPQDVFTLDEKHLRAPGVFKVYVTLWKLMNQIENINCNYIATGEEISQDEIDIFLKRSFFIYNVIIKKCRSQRSENFVLSSQFEHFKGLLSNQKFYDFVLEGIYKVSAYLDLLATDYQENISPQSQHLYPKYSRNVEGISTFMGKISNFLRRSNNLSLFMKRHSIWNSVATKKQEFESYSATEISVNLALPKQKRLIPIISSIPSDYFLNREKLLSQRQSD
eukprot:NODE_58_length_28395_cov_1.465720.p6 type:complete len:415 gc:universal NODE_58_length_28395_cov_1.465720:19238-17994(-)